MVAWLSILPRYPLSNQTWLGLMKRWPLILALCTVAVLFAAPEAANAQYPLESDVASPEAIVLAAYKSIERAPGENFEWDRFRSLFIENATLIPNTEQRNGSFDVISPEGFIEWIDSVTTIGGPNDKGFTEEEVHNVVERYGDIAHVFSTYQKHYWGEEEILGLGINSFQVVHSDDRWWIVSIIWDEETGAGPIPDVYLGE